MTRNLCGRWEQSPGWPLCARSISQRQSSAREALARELSAKNLELASALMNDWQSDRLRDLLIQSRSQYPLVNHDFSASYAAALAQAAQILTPEQLASLPGISRTSKTCATRCGRVSSRRLMQSNHAMPLSARRCPASINFIKAHSFRATRIDAVFLACLTALVVKVYVAPLFASSILASVGQPCSPRA